MPHAPGGSGVGNLYQPCLPRPVHRRQMAYATAWSQSERRPSLAFASGPCSTFIKALRKSRHRGVKHHWCLAKRLSPTLQDETLARWLIGRSLPTDPRLRIFLLLDVRRNFARTANSLGILYVNAAIWREITRLKCR